jgi:hypothetical protein
MPRRIDRLMLALGVRRTPTPVDPDKVAVRQRLDAAATRLEPVLTALQARLAQKVVREAGKHR